MKLFILSGLSGSGKSTALDTLEDCGFYCIDNLPVMLLEDFVRRVMSTDEKAYRKTAIVIDSRNSRESLAEFSKKISLIKSLGINCETLYLQAEHSTLLRRYSETRRRHPLTSPSVPLEEAIELEHQILEPVAQHVDLVIDTTRTNFHQLRELIRARVCDGGRSLSLLFQSFGFKYGIPLDTDFIFDARCLPNPHWEAALRGLTGADRAVMEFLEGVKEVQEYLQEMATFLRHWLPRFEAENRSYLTVAVGCTGGQHRSVFLVERLAEQFRGGEWSVLVRHRELS